MSYMLCYSLIPRASSVIGHRFEKAADSFLIILRDTSELINQLFLGRSKQLPKRRRTTSGEHISRVDTMFFKSRHIAKVE